MWKELFSSLETFPSRMRLLWEAPYPPIQETFHRHEMLPGWDQEKLNSLRMLSVGAGALGGWLDRVVVRMGLAQLDIMDYDRVEASNLPRQPFTIGDLGKPKAYSLQRHMLQERTNGQTKINAYPYSLEKAIELGLKMEYDIAYVGVDSDQTRAYAARLFVKHGIPAIFAGTGRQSRKGYVFIQKSTPDTACLVCLNPEILNGAIKEGCHGAAADVPVVLAGMAIYGLESLVMNREICWDFWQITLPSGKSIATRVAKKGNCAVCAGRD